MMSDEYFAKSFLRLYNLSLFVCSFSLIYGRGTKEQEFSKQPTYFELRIKS